MSTLKEERLQIRIDPANEALLERAAAATHLNVSAFVVQAAVSRAEAFLAERSSILLSPQAAATFSEALDRPGEVNDRLSRALRRKRKFPGLTELRRPTLLDLQRHDRGQFECGEPVQDEWLRRYAGQNRRRDTAATWVVAYAHDVVAAYASIAMTGLNR